MTRSYSDPSYGSRKIFSFDRVSMGTRNSDAKVTEAGIFTALHPITVTGWNITCSVTGDGGTSVWVLKDGTTALGTLAFVTNPTEGTNITADFATPTTLSAGDQLNLFSATSVASPSPFASVRVEYIEDFVQDDT